MIIESRRTIAAEGPSLWHSISHPAVPTAPFKGRAEVEIAIVGGGIAGLSLAFHLAEAGKRPMVLEAARCGDGASGASAGIVAPQLVRTTPRLLLQRLGQERGMRLLSLIAEAGDYTFNLARAQAMDCAASQSGFLAPARTSSGVQRLSAALREWGPFRSKLQWLDARAVRNLSGCEGYEGGLLDQSGGGLNPLAYAREMMRLAAGAGASIHEESRVLDVRRAECGWCVRTDQGEVAAAHVVLCANGGNPYLHPALRHTVLPLPVYQVATEPLDENTLSAILPMNHVMTDIETDVFSLRRAPGQRLVTAYPAAAGVESAFIEAAVNHRLHDMLHLKQPRRLEFVWHGTAWINQDLLPRLVGVADNLTAIQACNARGIALNTVLGREVARWLMAPQSYSPALTFEAPRRIRGFGVARHVPQLLMTAAKIVRRFSQTGRE